MSATWYSNAWLIAFVSAHYVWLALPAWIVFAWRMLRGRLSRREALLMVAFVACILLEVLQLAGETRSLSAFSRREHWSLSRYFGVFAPLLWIWVAQFLGRLPRPVAWCVPAVLLVFGTVPFFADQTARGPARDYWAAGKAAREAVRATWMGPRRYRSLNYSLKEYYTARRPVCFDDWSALACWTGGQSEGANLGLYPNPPDYLLLNANSGYRGGEAHYDRSDYAFLGAFEGTQTSYGLFKRK